MKFLKDQLLTYFLFNIQLVEMTCYNSPAYTYAHRGCLNTVPPSAAHKVAKVRILLCLNSLKSQEVRTFMQASKEQHDEIRSKSHNTLSSLVHVGYYFNLFPRIINTLSHILFYIDSKVNKD